MKPSKYRNKKTVVDGITFDSKKEAKRYGELKLMEKAGEIEGLVLQPRFNFEINGVKLGYYKADFKYTSLEPDKTATFYPYTVIINEIVEDCKGFKTPVYNLKKKLMRAIHGIDIYET